METVSTITNADIKEMLNESSNGNGYDLYQAAYLAHQARKKAILIEIMRERHSERMFADKEVDEAVIAELIDAAMLCPSSCNRHGVSVTVVKSRDHKALINGVLVGAVGWAYRAPAILLLWGDKEAYKGIREDSYMPYLDAGVMVQQMFLMATAQGLHACYINPNMRPMNVRHFNHVFDGENKVFCGALAIGHPPNQ